MDGGVVAPAPPYGCGAITQDRGDAILLNDDHERSQVTWCGGNRSDHSAHLKATSTEESNELMTFGLTAICDSMVPLVVMPRS